MGVALVRWQTGTISAQLSKTARAANVAALLISVNLLMMIGGGGEI
jgi:hypothetical protein